VQINAKKDETMSCHHVILDSIDLKDFRLLHCFSFDFSLLSIVFHYFSKLFHIYVTLTFNRDRK
jgi:hypothetical protein